MNTLLIVLKGEQSVLNEVLADIVSKYPNSIETIKRNTKEDVELHQLYCK